MKFKSFNGMVQKAALIGVALSLGACTVEQGNFAVEKKAFTGEYDNDIIGSGIRAPRLLNSVYEINGKQILADIPDISAKDKDNVKLQDMDMTLTYRVKSEAVIPFILKFDDLVRGEHGYLLGQQNFLKEARSALQNSTRTFTSEEILNRQDEFEKNAITVVQKSLDEKYPGIFEVVDAKAYSIKVGDAIEAKIQNIARSKAATAQAEAELATIQSRGATALAEAKMIKQVADDSGLTVDQYLTFRLQKIMDDNNQNPVLTVPVGKPSAKP